MNDNADMASQAERYLEEGNVSVTIEVLAEVVYVLKGVYGLKRNAVSDILQNFLELVFCDDADVVKMAAEIYSAQNLDFVDCVLYAYHVVRGAEIVTFDKKLIKLLTADIPPSEILDLQKGTI